MKTPLILAVFIALTAPAAQAELTPDALAADLAAQGYNRIEIRTGPARIRAEAIRGTERLELLFDRATGALLRRETERLAMAPGGRADRQGRDDGIGTEDESGGPDDSDDDGADRGNGHADGSGHDDTDRDDSGRDGPDDDDRDDDDSGRDGPGDDD